MVIYNPKDWWKLIFSFHRSDTFRMTWRGMLGVGLYTGLVAYLENDFFHATFKNTTAIHSLIGFVLSLLLVMRTNTAYERWWEGRKLWGHMLTTGRSLAMKWNALQLSPDYKYTASMLLSNFFYASKEHLRTGVELSELKYSPEFPQSIYDGIAHIPNFVMNQLYSFTYKLKKEGLISDVMLRTFDQEMSNLTHNLGACERIKKTPIPYSYSLFLKKIIFIYIFTMPIGFVREFGYWAIPIVGMIFYVFTSIEILAEEIEDPFGTEANDLPTDDLVLTLNSNIDEILFTGQ